MVPPSPAVTVKLNLTVSELLSDDVSVELSDVLSVVMSFPELEVWLLGDETVVDSSSPDAVSYTHLTLPTNREV